MKTSGGAHEKVPRKKNLEKSSKESSEKFLLFFIFHLGKSCENPIILCKFRKNG